MGRRIPIACALVAALWAGSANAAPARLYSAMDGGESVSVQLIPQAAGARLVIVRKGANGCDVKVEGSAVMDKGAWHMTTDSTGKACDVQLTIKPAYAEFLENKCEAHGDACRLDDMPILQPH